MQSVQDNKYRLSLRVRGPSVSTYYIPLVSVVQGIVCIPAKSVGTRKEARSKLSEGMLERFANNDRLLREIVTAFSADRDALVAGLVGWIQTQLSLSESDARNLAETEQTLRKVFSEIPEAQAALDMLSAARRDAMGDDKALLELPLELRRLIEREKEEGAVPDGG